MAIKKAPRPQQEARGAETNASRPALPDGLHHDHVPVGRADYSHFNRLLIPHRLGPSLVLLRIFDDLRVAWIVEPDELPVGGHQPEGRGLRRYRALRGVRLRIRVLRPGGIFVWLARLAPVALRM